MRRIRTSVGVYHAPSPGRRSAALLFVWLTRRVACTLRDTQVLYVASMIRSVIALHDLVLNKIKFKDVEEARDREEKTKAAASKDAKAKDAKAGASESKESKS